MQESVYLCAFGVSFASLYENFLRPRTGVLLSLTCAYSGVYIAALPGKKAAGVCRTKRGNYGRAVIETN